MLSREQKKKIVKEMTGELAEAKGVVFSEFSGIPTRDIQDLRANLRKEQVKHKVIKLSLLKRALKAAGIDVSGFNYHQSLAISWSSEDEVAPARALNMFAKTRKDLKILAGVLDQELIGVEQVKQLAGLPGKQELLGQVVGVIAGPLRGLVSVLAGGIRGLVNVLNAVKGTKN